MKPSIRYKNKMLKIYQVENHYKLMKLMNDEICVNKFIIIEPNI